MADLTLKMLLLGRDVSASKALKGVGKNTDESKAKFTAWQKVAAGAGVAVGLAIVKFGKDSVKAYADAQASQAALQQAFQKFPALADTNIGALRKLNSELERKTGFDDDATASGQAVLAQFKLTGAQITQLTPLLQDYAKKTGQDLPSAASSLGKAMLGQGRALKTVGINFKDTHTAAGNFDQIMTGLRANVGGFAEDQGKTAAGQAAILKVEFGELEEKVGSGLVPALTVLASKLITLVTFITDHAKAVGIFAAAITTAAVAAATYNVAMGISAVLTGEATASTVVQTIALGAQKVALLASTAAWWAFDAAMAANPIGLVIIGIVALVAVLVLAYRRSATFRAVVQGAFTGVKIAGQAMWTGLKAAFNGIKTAGQFMWRYLKPIFEALIAAFHAAQAAASWVSNIAGSGGPALSSLPQSPANRIGLRGHAAGGIFTRPTVGLIGEAGPEALIPLSAGRSQGGFGGGGDTFIFHINALDMRDAGAKVEQIMQDHTRRTGRPAQFRALPA